MATENDSKQQIALCLIIQQIQRHKMTKLVWYIQTAEIDRFVCD